MESVIVWETAAITTEEIKKLNILGIAARPRKNGNVEELVRTALDEAQTLDA